MENFGSVSVYSDSARGYLHRLLLEHQLALDVAGEHQPARGDQRDEATEDRGRPVARWRRRNPDDAGAPRVRLRTIHQARTPATKVAAVRNAAVTACRKAQMPVLVGEKRHDAVVIRPGRWPGWPDAPTGCCMNELALMMKNADILTAIATIQIQARCRARGRL